MHLKQGEFLQNGKYKVDKVLGQGGFGITYLATQELLDRKVCIKEFFFKDSCNRMPSGEVILGTAGNKDLVERFLNKFIKEARTLAQFDHPNIIHVLDIFKENNTAYYVMDLIDGSSLEDIVKRRGVLSESDAVNYITQVAEALNYIHQHSVNHLDVKPANIMIRNRDSRAILIDFGVSKQYDSTGDQTSTTPVGISYGYAPMEQYRPGGVGTFSPPTDIYALGATLYKLVTGNVPPQAMEILNEGLTGLPQSLSSHIATAIKQAMKLRKIDRPQSIQDFLSLLNVSNSSSKVSSYIDSKQTAKFQSVNSTNLSIKERVIEIIANKLGLDINEVVMNASLENDLGADSLDAVEFIMDFETEFDIIINDERVKEINKAKSFTVADVIAYIENEVSSQNVNQKVSSETTIIVPSQNKKKIDGYEYVDLGLPSGLMWATCNIGAMSPEEFGNYYSWGETCTKSTYDIKNCKTIELVNTTQLEEVDRKENFTDVAKASWGNNWRLPSLADIEELKNICIWSAETQNGIKGSKVTGPNGNSIFLPACGYMNVSTQNSVGESGFYLSSTPFGSNEAKSYLLFCGEDIATPMNFPRWPGYSVRPVYQPNPTTKEPKYVDLGLSVKWAECNLGAALPHDHGYYYSWGETCTKFDYSEETSKINGQDINDISGNLNYDAAAATLGKNWRMPTKYEIEELVNKCKWQPMIQNGIDGCKVIGLNGNSIFIPTSGCIDLYTQEMIGEVGAYHSSSPYKNDNTESWGLIFNQNGVDVKELGRCLGLPIRPVFNEKPMINCHEYVDLGLSVKWATCNIGASSPYELGDLYAWGETSTKQRYTPENCETIQIQTIEKRTLWVTTTEQKVIDKKENFKDTARANWGGTWRMPTEYELSELALKCTWEQCKIDGKAVFKVTGPNGKSIYLHDSGICIKDENGLVGSVNCFWSSTPDKNEALYLLFFNDYHYVSSDSRYKERAIRPVSD